MGKVLSTTVLEVSLMIVPVLFKRFLHKFLQRFFYVHIPARNHYHHHHHPGIPPRYSSRNSLRDQYWNLFRNSSRGFFENSCRCFFRYSFRHSCRNSSTTSSKHSSKSSSTDFSRKTLKNLYGNSWRNLWKRYWNNHWKNFYRYLGRNSRLNVWWRNLKEFLDESMMEPLQHAIEEFKE